MSLFNIKPHPAFAEIKAAVEREFPHHKFQVLWTNDSCDERVGCGPQQDLRCLSHRGVEVTPHLVIKDERQGRIILVDNLSNERGVHIENVEEATRRFVAALREDIEWIDAEWPGIDQRPPQGGGA